MASPVSSPVLLSHSCVQVLRTLCLLQSFMFAVYTEAEQNIQNATGPIDDGYITNVVGALPGDALCCSGPEALDDGMPLLHL